MRHGKKVSVRVVNGEGICGNSEGVRVVNGEGISLGKTPSLTHVNGANT